MPGPRLLSLPLVAALLALAAWWFWPAPAPRGGAEAQALLAALAALAADANQPATPAAPSPPASSPPAPSPVSFPADHAPHPEAAAEVWDLSAGLTDDRGRPFGLRLTLLRVAMPGQADGPPRASAFAARAVMLARLTLLRPDGAPLSDWRAARLALGLAGAEGVVAPGVLDPAVGDPAVGDPAAGDPAVGGSGALWVEDWRLRRDGDGRLHLTAVLDDAALALTLVPAGAPVSLAALARRAPGRDAGEGRGQAGAAAAPRGYLQPRLAVDGRLTLHGEALTVSGRALLEHGWGDGLAALAGGRGQLALNRFTLSLDDGTTLACVHLRRRAGGGTPVPTCLLIDADGGTVVLERRALTLEPVGRPWRNRADDSRWPLSWRLAVPAQGLDLRLQPAPGQVRDDALLGPVWSGLVQVSGRRGTAALAGGGRMELGGYGGVPGG